MGGELTGVGGELTGVGGELEGWGENCQGWGENCRGGGRTEGVGGELIYDSYDLQLSHVAVACVCVRRIINGGIIL